MRIEDHPGIVFRDGPGGRRAGVAGGPDVWEIIAAVRANEPIGDDALTAAAEWGSLTLTQVRTAVRYHAEYPDRRADRTQPGGGRRRRGAVAS